MRRSTSGWRGSERTGPSRSRSGGSGRLVPRKVGRRSIPWLMTARVEYGKKAAARRSPQGFLGGGGPLLSYIRGLGNTVEWRGDAKNSDTDHPAVVARDFARRQHCIELRTSFHPSAGGQARGEETGDGRRREDHWRQHCRGRAGRDDQEGQGQLRDRRGPGQQIKGVVD